MIFYIITLIVVFFTSIGHVLLKIASSRYVETPMRLYTNPISLIAYGIFAFVAFLSIYAMKGLEVKVFFALTSLTYVCVPFLSYICLKESITRNRMIGIVIISIGVIIFAL